MDNDSEKGYPPVQGQDVKYPPPAGGYPPQQGAYPPQQQQGAYPPPQQSGYPPQNYGQPQTIIVQRGHSDEEIVIGCAILVLGFCFTPIIWWIACCCWKPETSTGKTLRKIIIVCSILSIILIGVFIALYAAGAVAVTSSAARTSRF